MQHQLSTSTTISPVKPSPIGNRASARVARFAETEAPCAMQFKKALDFSNAKPKARERVRLVETALRAAAQRSAPQASSGARCSDRQHSAISPPTSSVDGKRFRKSRIVAITSFAVALPSLVGVAVWLSVIQPLADVSQKSQFMPSPVLTAPALLEATAGESLFLPIALDGTDGVPADSTITVTGLPQGATLSKGRSFGDTGWKLERDEIGDLQLVLSGGSAGGQTKLTIELVAPDATVVADAEILLQVMTAPQDSLPRNAEATDTATLAAAEPALSEMTVPPASPETTDAQLMHEDPQGQPDLELREAKPSAAATKRGEEPVESEPRIVQAEPRAPVKRTVAIVGTNEVTTSLFVNLRQAPSPSAKVIRVVAKGTKLRVVARKGRWVQVTDPATSANGWIYTGNANLPRTTKPSAPGEQSEDNQPKPNSGDTQPKPDSIWPSFLRGVLATG